VLSPAGCASRMLPPLLPVLVVVAPPKRCEKGSRAVSETGGSTPATRLTRPKCSIKVGRLNLVVGPRREASTSPTLASSGVCHLWGSRQPNGERWWGRHTPLWQQVLSTYSYSHDLHHCKLSTSQSRDQHHSKTIHHILITSQEGQNPSNGPTHPLALPTFARETQLRPGLHCAPALPPPGPQGQPPDHHPCLPWGGSGQQRPTTGAACTVSSENTAGYHNQVYGEQTALCACTQIHTEREQALRQVVSAPQSFPCLTLHHSAQAAQGAP
jgi:hypothetical protein